ncbi:unnamed protein product [Discula destructiva]
MLDFVCKHRPGANPRLGDPWQHGSYNYNVEIIFDDGIALVRFPIPGVVAFPDEKVRAEVATIRYVGEHTSIPVPHIHHWGTTAENPTALNVPFMIMEHIPHATTVGEALEDPDFKIPSVPDSGKREYLLQQMADIYIQLNNLTSDRIGSLGILDSGAYTVDAIPMTHCLANQVVNCRVLVCAVPPRQTTYASSANYYAHLADMQIAELLFLPKYCLKSAADCESKFAARCLLRDDCPSAIGQI